MTEEAPKSLTGAAVHSTVLLTKAVISTPAVLGILLLNVVMVSGWVWLLIQVSRIRGTEMTQIIALLDDCMKAARVR